MKKCLFILTIIGCTLSLFNLSGCNFLGNSDSQTVFPTGNSETDASLKLNVVLPESEDNLPGNAAIRGATTPSVKVILNIRQPGYETNKVQTLIKNFTVMSSAAEITFSNLPTGLIIAKMQIENGHIQGWKNLHGATDLVSGDNELDISPAGSKLKADLLASALQNAIENDKLMAAGGSTMATNLANALTTVDTDSVNPYNSVLNLLIDQINPTGIVKVEFDNAADTLTAFDGATQLWQKSYTATEILGTTPIAGIETTAFQAVRIVQQGFGDYFAIEWREPSQLVSLITTHNPADGQGKNLFINQGIFDQILAISDSEYVIGGFNASEKAPGIWKWNINKTGIVRSLAETSTNLDLEVYFSEIAYSAISTSGNVIENLMYDGQGNINAVIKTEDGESKTYLISLSDGSKTDITPSTSSNALPVVSITAPSDGTSVEVNNSLTISASASDSDGTISKVEFYAGSTLLESDQSEPYSYAWTPDTAGDYSITARAYDNTGESNVSTAISITVNSASSSGETDLLITEVSSAQYVDTPRWFEVYNQSDKNIELSNYSVRFQYSEADNASNSIPTHESVTFSAPSLTITPGQYIIVRHKADQKFQNGPLLVHIDETTTEAPYWGAYGYIELIDNRDSATEDYVKWGEINNYYPSEGPSTTSEWSGDPAAAMPAEEGYVLVRDRSNTDTNTASDWTVKAFSTPAAINDVIDDISVPDADDDGDGIPDKNEASGKTYCGLPYYDWGARSGQKDLFVHIDYMNPDQASNSVAVTPRKASLDKIKTAFSKRGITIHFDTGTFFGNTVNDHCLDGKSHSVTWSEYLDLNPAAGSANLYSYKAQNFPLAKLPVFHYCLIGENPNDSFSGRGEVDGNDFVVTLGGIGLSESSTEMINYSDYLHAAVLMHELGHNLGLRHGGDVATEYKPNYVSIMNYMYQNQGLPETGNIREGDRYYYYRYNKVDGRSSTSDFKQYFNNYGWWRDNHNNPYDTSIVDMNMDYSDGSGNDLDETNLYENKGLMRSTSAEVDFNGNGSTSDSGVSFDLNNDGSKTVLTDHDDWGAINLHFARTFQGVSSIRANSVQSLPERNDMLIDDFQEVVTCHLGMPHIHNH